LEFRHLLAPPHDVDRFEAAQPGDLEHDAPERRAGRRLEQPLSGLEREFFGRHDPGRERVNDKLRRDHIAERFRRGEELVGLDHHVFLPRARRAERDHALARLHAPHLGAEGVDQARAFEPGCGRELRLDAVAAAHEEQVGGVDRTRPHADEHLTGARHWCGHLLKAQDFGRFPESVKPHAAHACTPFCGWRRDHLRKRIVSGLREVTPSFAMIAAMLTRRRSRRVQRCGTGFSHGQSSPWDVC
jgi:hypothetical protein